MDNTLWGKLFHIARNFGDQKDLDVVNFLTGKGPYKKHKSKNRVRDPRALERTAAKTHSVADIVI